MPATIGPGTGPRRASESWVIAGLTLQTLGVAGVAAFAWTRLHYQGIGGHVTAATIRPDWHSDVHTRAGLAVLAAGAVLYAVGSILMARPYMSGPATPFIAVPRRGHGRAARARHLGPHLGPGAHRPGQRTSTFPWTSAASGDQDAHLVRHRPPERGRAPLGRAPPPYFSGSNGQLPGDLVPGAQLHRPESEGYCSTQAARFVREEASPAAWSSAEMPSGPSSATMSTRVPGSTAVDSAPAPPPSWPRSPARSCGRRPGIMVIRRASSVPHTAC